MKILLATPLYPPDIGGPATYSTLLALELPQRGYNIEVVSFGEVKHLPKIISHAVYFFKVLRKGKDADIIYALDPVSVGLPAALASFFLKKRFFVRIAGDYAWEQASYTHRITESPLSFSQKYKEYPFKIRIYKEIQTEIAKRAEKIIVPSSYIKQVIFQWGIQKRKIRVIHNASEPSPLLKDKKTLRGLLHFDGILLISAGRLIPLKGFDTLIDVIPVLKRSYPRVKLLIVGDGPDRMRLEKKIGTLKLGDAVVLTGALKQDVLFGYIQASDVFVLNALHETFSHQILEAMSLGVPVVTTVAGGNPEIIEHNKSGMLVEYNNKKALVEAVRKVIDDKIFCKKIVSGATERLKLFDKGRILDQIASELR
ncbi:glycosyltransferase family 4 protein [Candidatus Kaiserbacteria bacterium]|nr:glycosyltransferase family 4 protein [Candidatus Kaiserbacteria bacterium]